MKLARIHRSLIALTTVAAFTFVSDHSTGPARAQASSNSLSTIEGRVILVGDRVAGASVTLYAAGEGTPTEVARSKTDAEGRFQLDARSAPEDSVLYVVAKGPNQAVALMTLLGTSFPKTITVNELTTVASTFTAVRFIKRGHHLRKSARTSDCRREYSQPGRSGDRRLGQSYFGSGQQHLDYDASESEHARLPHQRVCHGRRRRLALPLPPGGNFYRWGDAQEHSRSDGWHRSYAMGQPEGALRVVRRSLPATEGRCPA